MILFMRVLFIVCTVGYIFLGVWSMAVVSYESHLSVSYYSLRVPAMNIS